MKASEMINKVVMLLGYTDGSGDVAPDTRLTLRAVTAINAVYADLYYVLGNSDGFSPIIFTTDEIKLPERVLYDIMPYGAAAFLARSENDGDQQQFFISMYNQKRAALTRSESVEDSMPTPE